MGPSGCGKSTLLNVLGLLDNSTEGEYYFFENEVSKFSERKRTGLGKVSIGFIFQSFNLIDELTVYENVELPLLYLKVNNSERKKRVQEVLEQLILADEPTGNLDSTNVDEVMRLLVELNKTGSTIVMVTHSPTYGKYGNRIVNMFDGKIISENVTTEYRL